MATDSIYNDTIFVSIVAYKDPHLQRTIQEALRNAANAKRIFFGIIEQERIEYRISPQKILEQIHSKQKFGISVRDTAVVSEQLSTRHQQGSHQ